MTNFLADIFEKLANDPSWPWEARHKNRLTRIEGVKEHNIPAHIVSISRDTQGRRITTFIATINTVKKLPQNELAEFMAQSPLTMARLALMVVEIQKGRSLDRGCPDRGVALYDHVLGVLEVDLDHYTAVKERVEKAKVKQ